MRFDPAMTEDQIRATLVREATEAWGAANVDSLRAEIDTVAWAIATIARERLETTDEEPFGGYR
jgi:hypothetical protein